MLITQAADFARQIYRHVSYKLININSQVSHLSVRDLKMKAK